MADAEIGLIGLGVMGRPMARNLLKRGFPLVVHSRSRGPVDEIAKTGATAADSAAEVAKRARRIITMLPDGPDVEKVLLGTGGVLNAVQPDSILIDMSTIAPTAARSLAKEAARRGARAARSHGISSPTAGEYAG